MSFRSLSPLSQLVSLPWSIPGPALTIRDAWLLDITSALIVHFIYNRYEPQPINLFPTVILLIGVPLLPASNLLSHLQAQPSWHDVFRTLSLAYVVFYATLVTSIVLYRMSPFHPLAKFPGPRLAKISQLWASIVISDGKRHKHYKKLHDQYGPYVRVGPNELSCIDTKAIPHILGADGLPKGPMWLVRRSPKRNIHALISLQDIDEHHRRRKIWNRAFSTTAVKDYERTLEFRAVQLAEELEKRSARKAKGSNIAAMGETVDLSVWFSYFAFDFMGDMAFGRGFNLMKDGDAEGIWHMMEGGIQATAILQHIPYVLPWLWKFPSLIAPLTKFASFSENLGRERIAKGSTSKDVFHYLIDDDGHESTRPPLPQIISDAALAVIAGSDTTSTVLGNVFFNILANPEVHSRLREEVDRYFPAGEAEHVIIDSAKLAEMPYLNAVINESMRLRPPVPVNVQRATTRSEGKWIGSYFLPPGTAINVPPYIIHRDEKNFSPLPDTFWPDRWLPQHQRRLPTSRGSEHLSLQSGGHVDVSKVTTNHAAFLPFSHGPANCVGKNLAILELRSVVSLLVRRFDMKFGDDGSGQYKPDRWEDEGEDWFVFKNGKLPVVLTRRN